MYPSQYERFALYPPEIFEKFMQASFDSYGHEKSSVLDGGLHQWVKKGLEISTEDVQLPTGNWKAKDHVAANNITCLENCRKRAGKEYWIRQTNVTFWMLAYVVSSMALRKQGWIFIVWFFITSRRFTVEFCVNQQQGVLKKHLIVAVGWSS
ncbi:hypothetical protein COOONC_18343 [Cooperia oncophora]